MEILSTGEKIKRSRIYKGITLKELCEDKISISKMSCIENGKIDADKKILKYIAEKLGLDLDYLLEDIKIQIENSIRDIESYKGNQYEQELKTNFDYSIKYNYIDLAVSIIRKLFKYYLDNNKYTDIEKIIPQYYDLYQKNLYIEDIYYKDMAMYFFRTGEFLEAITYFNNIDDKIGEANKNAEYFWAESLCYSNNKEYTKAFECINKAIKTIKKKDDEKLKAQIQVEQLVLKLQITNELNEGLLDDLCKKIVQFNDLHVTLYLQIAEVYAEKGNKDKFLLYVDKSKMVVKEKEDIIYATYLNRCILDYMNNDELSKAEELLDKALNLAIILDNIKLIERAYYLKSKIYQKKDQYEQSEIYMNLSIDALIKFSNFQQMYNRYIEMGHMYYKLNDLRESIKYFTLAKNMETKI